MNSIARVPDANFIDSRKFEEMFSMSRRTFFLWIEEGRLTAYRPSARKTLVKRAKVEKIIEGNKTTGDIDS
jgi:hypothetical protein